MRITIVGGGNIGTQFAVHCAEKNHEVTVYTSRPEVFRKHLEIVDENNQVLHEGDIKLATNDPKTAFSDTDLVFITMPPTMMKAISGMICHFISPTVMIGVVPGNGGWECAFRKCIEKGTVFFGVERVPAIARLIRKGEKVRSTGYRDELHVASLPASYAEICSELVSGLFGIPCKSIPCYLNLTMTPSNPILHTTRLRMIFRDWKEGIVYKTIPLFYEEWDDTSSELLMLCDEEVQTVCRALPDMHLEYVKSLKEHYKSYSVKEMTKKICSIPAFKDLQTPSIQIETGFVPDLYSRYFTADFSFGLSIIQQVARLSGTKTPHIDATMDWYKSIAVVKEEFRFVDYGIVNKNVFADFYLM